MRLSTLLFTISFALGCAAAASADPAAYRRPPKAIADVLNAPPLPAVLVSPARNALLVGTPLYYPPVADLARPMLRLAGIRIDPRTNAVHHAFAYTSVRLERIPGGGGSEPRLPSDARIIATRFSPSGEFVALADATAHGTDLYVATVPSGVLFHIRGVELNALFGNPLYWLPDGRLVVRATMRTGPAPVAPAVPAGPVVQESTGKAGTIVTYEDMLQNPYDESAFTYYATSRLLLIDVKRESVQTIGPPGIYTSVSPSPSGKYLLVEQIHRPYSYLFPWEYFPTRISVLDLHGAEVALVADRPLQDTLPVDGVPVGPRDAAWEPGAPATLTYRSALDGGATHSDAAYHDALYARQIPTRMAQVELIRTASRIEDVTWIAGDRRAIVREHDWKTSLSRRWLAYADATPAKPVGAPLRDGDRYGDPGQPVTTSAPNGESVAVRDGDAIYLRGAGYGPDGRKPFLDRLSLGDFSTQRVFQSKLDPLDTVVALQDDAAKTLIVQRQSPTLVPNYYLHGPDGDRALTAFTDPYPQVRAITRRVVTYKRADGVDLSFTLYLPPGYKEGTRLPTLLWAYPLEYSDASVASQNANSAQTFQTIGGASEVFMALAGYAVLDNAAIPIVGSPQTVNDTYVEQLVAGAKAAIDKAVELGVTDPNRVAVAGHSYGAFMTANLLAHSTLFKAGIARSGAYNRTLTPFGFQNERRTYWQATDLYTKMSPFTYADKLSAPLLLIHGEADDNTGTFPIQSERMYAAIKGNGGIARLVMLPDEAHGYLGRESIATVLAEMVDWLDRWVKAPSPG
jgi:dipeptidyl aminopeptidase/acylaminoacyl peptidase